MLRIVIISILSLLAVSTSAYAQRAQKATCRDIPIRWFVHNTATLGDATEIPTAIRGDGSWYAASGNANSVIHVCGSAPSFDATIALGSKRRVSFVVAAPITGSVSASSLPAGTYIDSTFMNLRNILCDGCADRTQPFTTRMAFQIRIDRQLHRLRFMPTAADAPDRSTDPNVIPQENTPYETSAVAVIPQPYNCLTGGATKPSWVIRGTNPSSDPNVPAGENLQVATLSRVTTNSVVHLGQYSMPFEMRIEALSCFNY